MSKAKYSDVTSDVSNMLTNVMNAFPDLFIHVKRNDVLLVFLDKPKNSWKAKIRLLNGFYRMLTQKKIVIELWKQEWELLKSKPAEQALLLYRELYKVDLNKEKSDYKLVKEDLKDFKKIIEKVGLHSETVDQFFSGVVSPVNA